MTSPKLKVGVLETGRPPEELARFGDYPGMVQAWLGPLEASYQSWAALDGDLPEDPRLCDLWVITGSKFGVYEDHPWIAPAEAFIRACRDAGRPMFGICFGHQLIAQALGGKVGKSDKGWGLGVHDYAVRNWPEGLGQSPQTLQMQAYHQDQVITPPDGAQTVAASDFCEHAALWYPGFALTVQGHPEFAHDYAATLLEYRKRSVLRENDVALAMDTMEKPTNRAALAQIIRDSVFKADQKTSKRD